MRKVYCKNCKWFVGTIYGRVGITRAHCYRATGKIIKDYVYGDYKEYFRCQVGHKDYPNKRDTNGCKHYIRKWYKFWIKQPKLSGKVERPKQWPQAKPWPVPDIPPPPPSANIKDMR